MQTSVLSTLALGWMLLSAAPAVAQFPEIRAGEPVGGTLSATDTPTGDGSYSDSYLYRGQRGERLTISLQSPDFDSYLWFARLSETSEPLDIISDDDGGDNADSRLQVTLEQDGAYVVVAGSYRVGATGAYRLEVTSERRTSRTAPIAAGSAVQGDLEAGDATLSDGSYYDEYLYRGTAGEQLTIDLESDDFDAYLAVGRRMNGDFESLETDDDGGDLLNSRLVYRIPESGEYVIRANSLGSHEVGRYLLRVHSER